MAVFNVDSEKIHNIGWLNQRKDFGIFCLFIHCFQQDMEERSSLMPSKHGLQNSSYATGAIIKALDIEGNFILQVARQRN